MTIRLVVDNTKKQESVQVDDPWMQGYPEKKARAKKKAGWSFFEKTALVFCVEILAGVLVIGTLVVLGSN